MADAPNQIENRFRRHQKEDYERLIRDLQQTIEDLNVELKKTRAILDVLMP